MAATKGAASTWPTTLAGHCLVTGVAGFIGSHLAERLIEVGCTVVGLDSFTTYYARHLKERNLRGLVGRPGFEFREADLASEAVAEHLEGVDFVFHQAGQPGVRASWGDSFEVYARDNIIATQRLLEACRTRPSLRRFVYASSSSIYGNVPDLPFGEGAVPHPISPYGVSKLAGEHLCRLYAANFAIPTVSLRYFTVYGPRQRPDMAFARFFEALLDDQAIQVHGNGEQTRDFTFISDAVEANLLAANADIAAVMGSVYNIGGGSRVTMNQVLDQVQELVGRRARITHLPAQNGDARHTLADTRAARRDLGFLAGVRLVEGLRLQVEWTLEQRSAVIT